MFQLLSPSRKKKKKEEPWPIIKLSDRYWSSFSRLSFFFRETLDPLNDSAAGETL
jgi:hypothetical protein